MLHRRCRLWTAALLLAVLLTGCGRRPASVNAVPAAETPSPIPTAAPTRILLIVPCLTPVPTAAPTATPTPVPTPAPTATPVPTPDGLCGGRFPDKFTPTEEISDLSYQSRDLAIFLSKVYDDRAFSSFVTYFMADIYVQDITLLRTASAGRDFSVMAAGAVKRMAQEHDALFAASGDYYAHSMQGLIIRNGVSYNDRPSPRFESCVLFRDGTMEFYDPEELDVPALLAAGAWQGWTFGPSLLDENGEPRRNFAKAYASVSDKNPRCMLGYFEPGHYCLVLADGRQPSKRYSNGLTLLELGELASDLGCTKAYNLDGGQSAQIYWQGDIYNRPTGGGRSISDILYFAAPDAP